MLGLHPFRFQLTFLVNVPHPMKGFKAYDVSVETFISEEMEDVGHRALLNFDCMDSFDLALRETCHPAERKERHMV